MHGPSRNYPCHVLIPVSSAYCSAMANADATSTKHTPALSRFYGPFVFMSVLLVEDPELTSSEEPLPNEISGLHSIQFGGGVILCHLFTQFLNFLPHSTVTVPPSAASGPPLRPRSP